MKTEGIIPKKQLPPVFLDKEFKHFRVAGEEKITLNVATGNYATGKKNAMLLYSYKELEARGNIPGANYLQFVPEGTPYAILDFDTDKKLSAEDRQEQVEYICKKLLHQFDGRIELSSSKLGIHAYIQDKKVKGLSSDPFKFHIADDKGRRIDVEVFASNAPIILTCDLVEKSIADFDTIPAKLMKIIQENTKVVESTKFDNVLLTEMETREQLQKDSQRDHK